MRTHDEVSLRAAPELGRSVLGHAGHRGVRLDVALVDGRRLELALDYDVRLLESGLDVAERYRNLGDIRTFKGA